jgi:solute carrier family 25 phosphate transporter 23/24/25/41
VSSVPIRLATASDADTVDDQDTDERGQGEDYPYTVSTRIRETMAEHSAVISTFIAGGLAGAASRTVVSPLERLKIIL